MFAIRFVFCFVDCYYIVFVVFCSCEAFDCWLRLFDLLRLFWFADWFVACSCVGVSCLFSYGLFVLFGLVWLFIGVWVLSIVILVMFVVLVCGFWFW